ncbi:hypothetical protein Ae168Ps1_3630 [Pseudonocardia sp. Ae168_Ps1]|nr:hypothetical protein Ae150APs1_3608 [Pseudonocardia sp. Ae150A_Ps1]OLL81224.1 hypothetical protein Ae168Ps1_3630 [Pseudonocardia sp. Ae168_Ps1]OLL84661.1 hypothetical protein Ae263Ps1_1716c [Pseudonocardia sp. Ae263_Ps1]OLL95322.1 hypothetical protein Ae356Ps1_5219 [Pseudonocardia sp. Ae356_Ps1]
MEGLVPVERHLRAPLAVPGGLGGVRGTRGGADVAAGAGLVRVRGRGHFGAPCVRFGGRRPADTRNPATRGRSVRPRRGGEGAGAPWTPC